MNAVEHEAGLGHVSMIDVTHGVRRIRRDQHNTPRQKPGLSREGKRERGGGGGGWHGLHPSHREEGNRLSYFPLISYANFHYLKCNLYLEYILGFRFFVISYLGFLMFV